MQVRAAVASVIMGLSPIVGRDATVEQLLPLFLQLLNDDFPEVRLNIISTLHSASTVIGTEQLSHSLLPAITELAHDRQWRVRMAIIEYMPLLASQLGPAYFDEKLGAMCIDWLRDCVFAIREAAIDNLRKLIEVFGIEWAQHIIPQILEAHKDSNYLFRMTVLYAVVAIAPVVTSEMLAGSMVPMVIHMSDDPVPNVRFNAAKTLRQLGSLLDAATVIERVKPCLSKLTEDADHDVRYFASQALQGF